MFRTEYEFTLPLGYVDKHGTLHRDGVMRLATAADEIQPLRDPRVQSNPAYLSVIVLARVITRLGSLEQINTNSVESLFAADFTYLQDLYNEVNQNGAPASPATCPECQHTFDTEKVSLGGL